MFGRLEFGLWSAWLHYRPERRPVPLARFFGKTEDREEADGVYWACPHEVLHRENVREVSYFPSGDCDEVGFPIGVNVTPAWPKEVKWPKELAISHRNGNVYRNVEYQGKDYHEAENQRSEEVAAKCVLSTVKELSHFSSLSV